MDHNNRRSQISAYATLPTRPLIVHYTNSIFFFFKIHNNIKYYENVFNYKNKYFRCWYLCILVMQCFDTTAHLISYLLGQTLYFFMHFKIIYQNQAYKSCETQYICFWHFGLTFVNLFFLLFILIYFPKNTAKVD